MSGLPDIGGFFVASSHLQGGASVVFYAFFIYA
jgi:hypothetical protein